MRIVRAVAVLAAVSLGAGAVALAVERPEGEEPEERVESVSGTLAADGKGYRLNGKQLGLGPPWWRETAKAADYDGDGTVETIAVELAGLRGKTVTVTGEADDDEVGVRTLAGKPYRAQGKPPWAGGRKDKSAKCKAKAERERGGPPPWAKAHGRRCS